MDMSNHDQFKKAAERAEPYTRTAEQVDARWAAKLGLKPGQKPVSMTDTVLERKPNGGWRIGG